MSSNWMDSNQNSSVHYYAGIDAGSISLNCVVINDHMDIVYEFPYRRHFGKVEQATVSLIRELYEKFGQDQLRAISFTGNHGKKLSERLHAFYEFDTISQVLGVLALRPDAKTIIYLGGQTSSLFQISHKDGGWELKDFNANGPCASGTGSFIDQQAQRLATSIYANEQDFSQDQIDLILADFIKLGLYSQKPANVACRCTVFTKSDMIHLQNKGEKLQDIIYGLHVGNARNYMSTIVSSRKLEEPIVLVGGLSLNKLQVRAFKDYHPSLIVPSHNTSTGALGVALQASKSGGGDRLNLAKLQTFDSAPKLSAPVAPRLVLKKTLFKDAGRVRRTSFRENTRVYLGIDIGSTTTKYALINEKGEVVHKKYVPTQGKPIEVTQNLLEFIRDDAGENLEILGTATTGSGRNVVGDFLDVDLVIDEITAHARGAVEIDPEVDTIFEIGGQDSKYIYICNNYPLDFDMNKVCAAGTGSFLHELANKYGINIVGEFQEIALSAKSPVKLAERCTVFMESDLMSYHQKGVTQNDLIGGLCYAIVSNYLNRVVGKRKIGRRVMFLGGPSLNKAVVAAFENVLGHGLIIPPHREVLGAFGAAISVQEKMQLEKAGPSSFRGLQSAINDRMNYTERICRVDPHCHNQCKLKRYDFVGRRSIWGGECGRYELAKSASHKTENFFKLRHEIWEHCTIGVCEELGGDPLMEVNGRPTVGMQRALYGHQSAILWAHFFDQLGFRLVLTPPTNARISKCGIESVEADICYPVKVSHGHVKELVGKTKYLFIPSMTTMPTADPAEIGSYCPMLQSNSYMLRSTVEMKPSSILNPIINAKYDPDSFAVDLHEQLRSKLKVTKSAIEQALHRALEMQDRYIHELKEWGHLFLKNQDPDKPVVVVTGRPYNLYDERLNLKLGENLAKVGLVALPMDYVDCNSVDLSGLPSMYWGLGAQILRTAKLVKNHPNCFGLHLTNFGCGPDSFVEHFYKNVMAEKPHLILELDEHSGVAGVVTRLEAFKNVIENAIRRTGLDLKLHSRISG